MVNIADKERRLLELLQLADFPIRHEAHKLINDMVRYRKLMCAELIDQDARLSVLHSELMAAG